MPRVRPLRIALLACLALLSACSTNAPVFPDAPFIVPDAGPPDAGPVAVWTESDPFPVPIAYATASILASGGTRWIFVIGGADADRDTITTMYSSVYRAELLVDGSLGPWESAGDLLLAGTMRLQLAQHAAIVLSGEDGRPGVAIAGGTSSAGPIPRVLAGYASVTEPVVLTDWDGFAPQLGAGEAHVLGTFDRFQPHEFALVGGFGGDGLPTERVDIALIDMSLPTFVAGPPLPSPRVAHRMVQVGTTFYVVGGESATASATDVLRSVRDMGTGDVAGWEVAGTMTDPPSDHASFAIDGQLWVVGGIERGRDVGLLATRARRSTIAADGTLGAFVEDARYELPVGLADSAVVVDDVVVYMIGGRSVGGLASSTTVLIGRF